MRFLLALFLLAPLTTFAKAPTACGKSGKWEYCTYIPQGSKRATQLLYFLHEAQGWQRSWEYMQEKLASTYGNDSPTVVGVSFGDQWLLTERNASAKSGLLRTFVEEVMPTVENSILKFVPSERVLLGHSMGGFNATQLVLKHPTLFSRVAMLCPGYITFNPHAPQAEVDAYLKRTGADAATLQWLVKMIQGFYPDAASWDAEAPLLNARARLSEKTPPLFIATAKDDPFGFHEGSEMLVGLAREAGVKVQFSERMARHCEKMDFAELGAFLAP